MTPRATWSGRHGRGARVFTRGYDWIDRQKIVADAAAEELKLKSAMKGMEVEVAGFMRRRCNTRVVLGLQF